MVAARRRKRSVAEAVACNGGAGWSDDSVLGAAVAAAQRQWGRAVARGGMGEPRHVATIVFSSMPVRNSGRNNKREDSGLSIR